MTEHWENLNALTAPLLTWYDLNGRTLPWRSIVTPYRTWVSEIMLQQTRVSAVIPYFERFMAELPDTAALADVPEERLLKLWEGLGYYSRARNLQKAAKVIVSDFGGELPRTCASLKTLPGIGDYTAAAIASINFGEPVAAVDGNLLRVAARVSGCGEDIMDAKVRRLFRQRLDAAIDANRPGRVQSGDDGPRRDGVPAERRAEVRDLPRANDVRGVQKRPHRSLTRAREEKGAQD